MSNMIDDAIAKWRNKRLHRKCIFCENFNIYSKELLNESYFFCECKAKKFDSVSKLDIPFRFTLIRPFCALFKLKDE